MDTINKFLVSLAWMGLSAGMVAFLLATRQAAMQALGVLAGSGCIQPGASKSASNFIIDFFN